MARVTFGSSCWKVNDYSLGSSFGGGYLICKSGGVGWIVSPYSTEVTRGAPNSNDAVTTAQAAAACGDWFVPTCGQLQNPGSICRDYWDCYSSNCWYISSTPFGPSGARIVRISDGAASSYVTGTAACVRAFRCVTY
jgi:hypothetical protein